MSKRSLPDIIDFTKGSVTSAAAVGVGTAMGDPTIGGILGGITATFLEIMIRKFVKKHLPKAMRPNLSINEEERLRNVLSHFNTKMIQNLSVGSGKTLRQDCFFSEKINERSAAEEIFEGVLFAAEREYEEKKVKFEGYFYANIVCCPPIIDRAKANFLLRLAQSLSYRQLCIVALFVQKENNNNFHLRYTSYRDIERFYDFNLLALLQDIHQLSSQGLLFIASEAMASPFDIVPTQMVAKGTIKELFLPNGFRRNRAG